MEDIWQLIGSSLLAFVLGSVVPPLELISGEYPETSFLLVKDRNRPLIYYGLAYGIIALIFNVLTIVGVVKLDRIGLYDIWGKAIVIGLTTKAFLHVNIYNVPRGSATSPIGLEYFVQFFEKPLLRKISLAEFNLLRQYLQPHVNKYSDLDDVKRKMKNHIPRSLPSNEIIALEVDIGKEESVVDAMETYIRYLGRETLERVFPL
jgi:hypothetical protein